MNVAIIADKYLATGYRLAGIYPIPVRDLDEAVKSFRQIVPERRFEILMVPEEFADRIQQEARLLEFEKKKPIIAVIPSFKGTTKGRALALYDLVSQAVGTKLKVEDER